MPDTHHVAGTVRQNAASVERTIHVIRESDGALLAAAASTGGAFDIGLEAGDDVHILAIPAAGFPPIVLGPYTPAAL